MNTTRDNNSIDLNEAMIKGYFDENGRLKYPRINVCGKNFKSPYVPVGDLDNPEALHRNQVDIHQYVVHYNNLKLTNLLTNVLPSDGFCIMSIPHQNRPAKLHRCLVIGCDSGHEFPILVNYFREVHGVEISEEHVQRAHQLGRDKVKWVDAVNMEYPHDYFDCVIGIHVFEHIKKIDVLLAQIFRMLKPGGKVCHVTPHITLRDGDLEPAHVTKLTELEWVKKYRRHGYKVIRTYFAWSLCSEELHLIAKKENTNGKVSSSFRRWFRRRLHADLSKF